MRAILVLLFAAPLYNLFSLPSYAVILAHLRFTDNTTTLVLH